MGKFDSARRPRHGAQALQNSDQQHSFFTYSLSTWTWTLWKGTISQATKQASSVKPITHRGAAKNWANHVGCTSASTIVPPMQCDTTTFIQCVLYFVQGR
ncbi:uncharacterized protein ARMOST_18038 [Armillaria ostoyae]|uniref:Uncharacterized protein n=1 Tax=Armillaria ostoyae TaxID=47428 RepID=A0A284S0P8_ARMOS|nr:uncharacterized protein ARMOST_18038 [Armillaria ostoyae]